MTPEALQTYDPLVKYIARTLRASMLQTRVLEFDDLLSVGRMAVVEALQSYTYEKVPTRTFVAVHIRYRMKNEIRRVRDFSRAEVEILRTQPTSEEAAALRARVFVPIDERNVSTHSQIENAIDMRSVIDSLRPVIDSLRPKERTVMVQRALGFSWREIAQDAGVCERRVRYLQRRGLDKVLKWRRQSTSLEASEGGKMMP